MAKLSRPQTRMAAVPRIAPAMHKTSSPYVFEREVGRVRDKERERKSERERGRERESERETERERERARHREERQTDTHTHTLLHSSLEGVAPTEVGSSPNFLRLRPEVDVWHTFLSVHLQVRREGVASLYHSKSGRFLLGSAIQKCSLPPCILKGQG